jgi:6-pyruvoyltetrahydropterin/6-carboxytetrahydropterin synthase
MYKVGITGALPVRHALRGDFGEESLPHGHLYRIEWVFTASELGQEGFVVDIAEMERARDMVLSRLAGVFLNDLPFFSGLQVSVENFARFCLGELLGELGSRVVLEKRHRSADLKVWENDTAWASLSLDLSAPA